MILKSNKNNVAHTVAHKHFFAIVFVGATALRLASQGTRAQQAKPTKALGYVSEKATYDRKTTTVCPTARFVFVVTTEKVLNIRLPTCFVFGGYVAAAAIATALLLLLVTDLSCSTVNK